MFEGPNRTTTDEYGVDHTVVQAGPCSNSSSSIADGLGPGIGIDPSDQISGGRSDARGADLLGSEPVDGLCDGPGGDRSNDVGDVPEVPIEGLFLDLLEPLIGVAPVALNAEVGELELRRRMFDAEMAAGIHAVEMSGAFALDGHRSMAGYLKATFNWSGGQAAQWLKVARFVTVRTAVGDAWAAGRIGFDQVLELQAFYANRRACHVFDQFLPLLLLQAEQLLFADFKIAVADVVSRADEDGNHVDRDTAVAHRNAHVHVNGAELDVAVIGGDPITAAEIVAIFDYACQQEFNADVAARLAEFGDQAANHPLPRTAGQRRHDAFIRVFRAGGTAITANRDAGTSSVAKIVVRVVIDEVTFRQILADAGLAQAGMIRDAIGDLVADPTGLLQRRCQMSDGTPIHPHDALRALLEGYVQRVVVDANSVVVDMGREGRLFTGSAREAALILAVHCDHPGCDLPAQFCDMDHNIEWANGGRTDQNNARPRCSIHNRFKSRNRWRSKQATNGYHYTIRDDGTIVLPIGARPPTLIDGTGEPTQPATTYTESEPEDPADVERLNAITRQRARALGELRAA